MNVSTLANSQQKRGVATKRKASLKGLRNVFAQPFNNYWPLLKNDQVGVLEQSLQKYLSSIQQPKTSIPWTQLRKMSKAERQAIKISKLKDEESTTPTSSVIFVTGINAVTRGLEKKCLNSVLLDSHVEPVLIKHVVVMCEADNIPIVLVPFLKTVTSGTIGFKTAAFALKKEVENSTDHNLHSLHKKILELSCEFDRPKLCNPLYSEQVSMIEKTTENIVLVQDDEWRKTKTEITVLSDIYLYRSSNEERVFIPEGDGNNSFQTSSEFIDYIPLGKNQDSKIDKSYEISRTKKRYTTTNDVYVPVKMKRMQGNNNRIKSTKITKNK
ncbi:uncharacterized protein LOC122499826 [Leptopilina heterotoma]|uniref:uncharacterized protein LOC122499826 n=1 Tax=Leptopilina heterotoma TaxID=63436 RepID=UPI001CA9F0FA|nr:uncharacterized protein LOC122499826 [Leptopilina heterotoma]